MTTFAFVAEGFDGSWQKIPHAGFQMKSTSNVEEPKFWTSVKSSRTGCSARNYFSVWHRRFPREALA
jgi:hypothetical protein